jgi:hypothetical protein
VRSHDEFNYLRYFASLVYLYSRVTTHAHLWEYTTASSDKWFVACPKKVSPSMEVYTLKMKATVSFETSGNRETTSIPR